MKIIPDEHKAILKNIKLSHKQVAELTGRKIQAIRDWRKRNITDYHKHFSIPQYSDYELALLNDITKTNKQISELTGRSMTAIKEARKYHGVDTSELFNCNCKSYDINDSVNTGQCYTTLEIQFIIDNKHMNEKQLAMALGRTWQSVGKKKKQLRLDNRI